MLCRDFAVLHKLKSNFLFLLFVMLLVEFMLPHINCKT